VRLKTAFAVEGDRNVPAPLIGTPVQRYIRLHAPYCNQIFEMRSAKVQGLDLILPESQASSFLATLGLVTKPSHDKTTCELQSLLITPGFARLIKQTVRLEISTEVCS
jgi:hypothetical protein